MPGHWKGECPMKAFEYYKDDYKETANHLLAEMQEKAQAEDDASSILGKWQAQTETNILIKETLQKEEGIDVPESKE